MRYSKPTGAPRASSSSAPRARHTASSTYAACRVLVAPYGCHVPPSSLYSVHNTHLNLSPHIHVQPRFQYINRYPYIPIEYTHNGCTVPRMGAWFLLDATPVARRRAIPRHTMFTVQVPQYTGLRATRVTKVRTTRFVHGDSTTRAARRRSRARAAAGTMTHDAWRGARLRVSRCAFARAARAAGARRG